MLPPKVLHLWQEVLSPGPLLPRYFHSQCKLKLSEVISHLGYYYRFLTGTLANRVTPSHKRENLVSNPESTIH
jgi:hypothetical protein